MRGQYFIIMRLRTKHCEFFRISNRSTESGAHLPPSLFHAKKVAKIHIFLYFVKLIQISTSFPSDTKNLILGFCNKRISERGFVNRRFCTLHMYRSDILYLSRSRLTKILTRLTKGCRCVLLSIFMKTFILYLGKQIFNPKTQKINITSHLLRFYF